MQFNSQHTQPRATDYNFRGNRLSYGQRKYGSVDIPPGDVRPEGPGRYQRWGEINQSVVSSDSGTQRSCAVGGNGNENTSMDSEACSTIKLGKLLTRNENDILFKLQTPSFGFVQRLQQGSNSQIMVQLLIKVIAKACRSVHRTQLIDLLGKIQNSNFLKADLLLYLNKFITEDKMVEPDICSFIIAILRTLTMFFPSKSLTVVTMLCAPLHRILTINTSDYDVVNEEYKKLQEHIAEIRKQLQSGTVQRDQERQTDWTVDESEDYRRMSVVPTSEDIRGQGDPYLRENKIFAGYKDAHDYLDVQVRLMKEDLVRPLREGLADLLRNRQKGNNGRTKSNMKVYRRVKITSVLCSQHGLIYRIEFDVSRLRHVRWEAGKRLMLGSLVCLSADEFKSMLIATVAERNVRDLSRGVTYLFIEKHMSRNGEIKLDEVYKMIESPAYYEPYKCVLHALQKFTDDEKLPFERYLLNKSGEESVPPPKYLTESVKYDFSSLMRRKPSHGIVSTLDLSTWPTAEELELDASQYNALQTAITKEFAVIQGPPGTGKTFIGVKLVQLMLENNNYRRRNLWNGPIMLVCFTNHALDQFLEEIIRIYPTDVDKGLFVRIGGTSKSENEELKKCFLRHIKVNRTSAACSEFRGATIKPKERMTNLEKEIMTLSAYAEIAAVDLIHLEVLSPYMRNVQFKHVVELLEWLCDRKAESGKPNLFVTVDANLGSNKYQNDVKNEQDVEADFDDLDFMGTEDREQNENSLKSAEEKFQEVAQSVMEENRFVKLRGQEVKDFKELYRAAQIIHRRFHQAFKESDHIIAVTNQWQLTLADRWRLYNYWTQRFVASKREEMQTLLNDHATEKRKLEEVQDESDYRIFSHAKIIAMTTTGAAKRSDLLKRLAPKIVIVEEAAEVLEAHVVASLSEECEHLILIGDHKQLKPKPADYSLAKRYRLDISLFEKVILNKLHCDRLTIQHRMRPEIAELLVPHIYKFLENHESVLRYENVANVFGNLFFVNHSELENSTDDNKSHSNNHEATFLSELCRYLLNVGYEPKQITILTTYTGQFFLLRKLMPKSEFEGVRITPVDNFQGEENDIILLSLVRSNEDTKIGFLKISNRVCVALSRARKGLYIIGNADLLRDESPLWRDILETLKKQNKLVDSLPLGCRNHPEDVIRVKIADDFKDVPRSGCKYQCEYRLVCGHACAKLCHEMDSNHAVYECKKPCSKLCANNIHPCRNLCFESCGDCNELVERTLSRCGHQATMPCYFKEENFECKSPCKLECSAGHTCQKLCYEKCKCQIQVTRTLTRCEHEATMSCYLKEKHFKCKCPCKLVCSAGHACQQLCYEKCECQVPVTRTLTRCQHEATMPCYLPEVQYKCNEPCKKIICPFGHPCNKLCFDSCWPCETVVIKTLPGCKHLAAMPCILTLTERSFKCEKLCSKSCSNNHPCAKLCSESCGKCEVPVTKLLPICGHEATMPCHMDLSMYLRENLCGIVVDITLPLCGHVMQRSCFASDLPYDCSEPCKKSCLYGHPCERRCHEPCGDCEVMVPRVLPRCEHKAVMACHQPAVGYECQIKCHRVCASGHECPELCHEKCGDCHAPVEKVVPSCGHKSMMPCYRDPSKHRCQLPCERKCPVGHLCPKICGADCGVCIRKKEKTIHQCNHVNIVECYQSDKHVVCNSPCEETLLCGHKCQETCGAVKCTITCKIRVEKELPCKHIARTYCYLDLNSVECYHEVERWLRCGHVAVVECHQDLETFVCLTGVEKRLACEHIATMACFMDSATYLCPKMVKVEVCDYGHTQEIKCCDMDVRSTVSNEPVTLAYNDINVQRRLPYTTYQNGCPNVCDFKLECGHGCPSTCRECVERKSHGKCNKIFGRAFSLCPHKSLCADLLKPCRNFSVHSCVHRRNNFYNCKESYELCLRSCNWNCPHYNCTTVCSQPCNRPPCNHPCRKPLRCGHVCSGLCGEPCILACRKCDKGSFMKMIWPSLSIPSDESRYLELQPCLHVAEVAAMDVWVQENVKQLPGILDSSCFLLCPVCSEKVSICPRYNQHIRRHELCLISAKKLIKASGNLKSTMYQYVELYLRSKQRSIKVKRTLNQLGVNERIKLGTLCILHEIEVLETQRKNLDSMQKCKTSLLNIPQRISEEEDLYFEDKPRLAADVIMMFKLYLQVQVRRLKTFIRGPSLRVIDKCSQLLDEIECIEVTEDNFTKIWTKVEKLNRKLSTKLSPQDRKDKITDYVDHLNSFYDLQLDADFLSHWACCRFGHVYSANEEINKDEIDSLCPECHPLHSVLLYFLKPEFDETTVLTKFDTAAYYTRNDITGDLSYPKRIDSDRRESDPLADIVPDGNVDILRGENSPDVTQTEARAAPKSLPGAGGKIFLGESSFLGGHTGRRGGFGNMSWTQARLNREGSSGGQAQLSDTTRESQTRSSFISALQSVDNPGQAFGGRDRSQSERSSCDDWRAKDGSQSGRATASTFSESSYKRNGASAANAKQTRESWRVSNNDDKDPENWRDSTARGRRENPLSWRDKARSLTE